MATPPPKVLRIGVNLDGKLVKDKLFKLNETVTFGESPKASIQLPPGLSPKPEFPMFTWKGGKCALTFNEKMKGKVGTERAAFSLQKIIEEPPKTLERTNDGWRLWLSEDDRGAITLGDNVRILFQFVSAPPSAPQKAPPVDFRPRFVEEDDTALFGFLTLFSALGLIFVVFVMSTTIVEIESITQLEDFADIIIVPAEPKIDEPVVEVGDTKAETKAEAKAETKTEVKAEKPAKSAEEQRADQKRNLEASSQLLALLTQKGGDGSHGTAIDRLGDSDAGRVKDALSGTAGAFVIADGSSGPRKGEVGGTGDVKMAQGGSIGGGGAVEAVRAPVVVATVRAEDGNTDAMTGDAGSVNIIVKKYTPQLKYCYETALKGNSDLAGRVEIEWNVSGGRVTSTSVFTNTTGDSAFAACIEGKIKKWVFPTEIEGEVQWPFVFKAASK